MKIQKDFRNDLLKRREIQFIFDSESNPGFSGALSQLLANEKVNEDVVVIKSVHGNFGSYKFQVDAFIYDNLEAKNLVEPKPKEKKK